MTIPSKNLIKVNISVPRDYNDGKLALTADDREWIEHIIERAADRGAGLEDTEAAHQHQEQRQAAVGGAKRTQREILRLAGEAFAAGQDGDASAIRKLAAQLDPLIATMEKERDDHKELFITSYIKRQFELRETRRKEERELHGSLPWHPSDDDDAEDEP